jgi:hypothetical protein
LNDATPFLPERGTLTSLREAARGRPLGSELAPLVTATAHPSSILRQRDDDARHAERRAFTEELERVAELLERGD